MGSCQSAESEKSCIKNRCKKSKKSLNTAEKSSKIHKVKSKKDNIVIQKKSAMVK
jgi:hypothetical protein